MKKRRRILSQTETELLTRSARRCCICVGLDNDYARKRGQITHLDRDSSNRKLDNLAWMCIPHHDEYDSKTRQSKGLTQAEVKRYRKMLYNVVESRRSEAERTQPTSSRIQAKKRSDQKTERPVTQHAPPKIRKYEGTGNMSTGPRLISATGKGIYSGTYCLLGLANSDKGKLLRIKAESLGQNSWIEIWRGHFDGQDTNAWVKIREHSADSHDQPNPKKLQWRIEPGNYTVYFVTYNDSGQVPNYDIMYTIEIE
jgi:hypothetical protein